MLTEKIAAAGATVVAVDAGARHGRRGAGARASTPRVMDGQKLTFAGEFDAVFSNAALHWMRDQEAVLAGVRRALKPGGRFVAEMGGHNNTAAIIVALSAVLARRGLDAHRLSPWYFPSADAYRKKLEAGRLCGRGDRDRPAADDPADRDRSLARHLRRGFSRSRCPRPTAARRAREIADLLRPVLMDETGPWIADYVRLRFRARLPAAPK